MQETLNRPLGQAMFRGFRGKCPCCGETSIFDGPLSIKAECEACGQDYTHHRADDLPAYLNIFIVGHVVIGFAMVMMSYKFMGMWATTFTTALLCVLVGLVLMRPLKGMIVGNQWALGMHGFGEEDNQGIR